MPRYNPPWLDKVNFILEYYFSGCEAPWSIYADAAWPTAKELAIALVALSADDILKEIFRPKGLRSARHGRKGRKSSGRPRGIPDVNELIAQKSGARELTWDRKYGVGTAALYVGTDVIDRVNNTAFMVEGLTDLAYSAILGALEFNGANCSTLGRSHKTGGYHVEGGAGPVWEPYSQGVTQYQFRCRWFAAHFLDLDEGYWSITSGNNMRVVGSPNWCQMRARHSVSGGRVLAESNRVDLVPGVHQDMMLNFRVQGPISIVFEITTGPGFVDCWYQDCTVLQID